MLEKVKGRVTFENVSFKKNESSNILENVSFDLNPGKTLGIMGETGYGKSTIINLLLRFYDVTQGSIKLDGVDIRNLTIKQLRGEYCSGNAGCFSIFRYN